MVSLSKVVGWALFGLAPIQSALADGVRTGEKFWCDGDWIKEDPGRCKDCPNGKITGCKYENGTWHCHSSTEFNGSRCLGREFRCGENHFKCGYSDSANRTRKCFDDGDRCGDCGPMIIACKYSTTDQTNGVNEWHCHSHAGVDSKCDPGQDILCPHGYYAMQDLRTCVESCPPGYFTNDKNEACELNCGEDQYRCVVDKKCYDNGSGLGDCNIESAAQWNALESMCS